MRRLIIKRKDLMHHDSMRDTNKIVENSYQLNNTGKRKNYDFLIFNAYSVKTGNMSRQVSGRVVEIENVSGLYVLVYTTKKFRSNETVHMNGKDCDLIPIGRLKHNNLLIYSIRKT